MVGGHGIIVERLGADREVQLPVLSQVIHGLPQHGGCMLEVLGLEVLGVGAVVCDRLVLVAEVLGDLLGAVGGHAEALGHVRDEHGQFVGQRRVLCLPGHRGLERDVRPVELRLPALKDRLVRDVALARKRLLAGLELEAGRLPLALAGGGELVEVALHVPLDGEVTRHHQPQGGRHHASHVQVGVQPERRQARLVHAEAHVSAAPGIGGQAGGAAPVIGDQLRERPADVLLDVVVYIDTLYGTRVAKVVQQLVHDELALVVGVSRRNDAVAPPEQDCDGVD